MGAATEMVPPDGADALEVDTVTFPKFSSLCRSVADRVDVGFVPVIVKGDEAGRTMSPVDSPDPIVISLGSSNKLPDAPIGARKSAEPWKSRMLLLELSTKPPSPLWAPPRAEMFPYIWVC